jgi:hypothetical protein
MIPSIATTTETIARLAPQPSRLRLLEAPKDDGVTGLRVEVKFAVPGADVAKIRTILDANCRRIFYNEAVSHVHSIYFDDPLLSGARENLGGADKRTKVRLRWYDSPEPQRHVFLEVKRRMNRMIGKDRLPIESSIPIAEMTYDELRDELARVLPPRFRETLLLRAEPVLINSYHREHFGLEGTPIRITLDSEIECFDQAGLLRPRRRFGVPLRDLVVIEGKAPCGSELELRRALHPLRLRVTRCTKYVQGCQALGVATGAGGLPDD